MTKAPGDVATLPPALLALLFLAEDVGKELDLVLDTIPKVLAHRRPLLR